MTTSSFTPHQQIDLKLLQVHIIETRLLFNIDISLIID